MATLHIIYGQENLNLQPFRRDDIDVVFVTHPEKVVKYSRSNDPVQFRERFRDGDGKYKFARTRKWSVEQVVDNVLVSWLEHIAIDGNLYDEIDWFLWWNENPIVFLSRPQNTNV